MTESQQTPKNEPQPDPKPNLKEKLINWCQKKWLAFVLLIVFAPLGIAAAWMNKGFSKKTKWIITGVGILLFICAISGGDGSETLDMIKGRWIAAPNQDGVLFSEISIFPDSANSGHGIYQTKIKGATDWPYKVKSASGNSVELKVFHPPEEGIKQARAVVKLKLVDDGKTLIVKDGKSDPVNYIRPEGFNAAEEHSGKKTKQEVLRTAHPDDTPIDPPTIKETGLEDVDTDSLKPPRDDNPLLDLLSQNKISPPETATVLVYRIGIQYDYDKESGKGLITQVVSNSPAQQRGLDEGDIVWYWRNVKPTEADYIESLADHIACQAYWGSQEPALYVLGADGKTNRVYFSPAAQTNLCAFNVSLTQMKNPFLGSSLIERIESLRSARLKSSMSKYAADQIFSALYPVSGHPRRGCWFAADAWDQMRELHRGVSANRNTEELYICTKVNEYLLNTLKEKAISSLDKAESLGGKYDAEFCLNLSESLYTFAQSYYAICYPNMEGVTELVDQFKARYESALEKYNQEYANHFVELENRRLTREYEEAEAARKQRVQERLAAEEKARKDAEAEARFAFLADMPHFDTIRSNGRSMMDEAFEDYVEREVLGKEVEWSGRLVDISKSWGKYELTIDMDDVIKREFDYSLDTWIETPQMTVPEMFFKVDKETAYQLKKDTYITFKGIIESAYMGGDTLFVDLKDPEVIF